MADEKDTSPQDQAARAAWLYYVGGMRQDQIAEEMGISRQRAQRLVARAVADGLVRVRIDHPVAACLELERGLKARFGLDFARVAPSAGGQGDALRAIAPVAAAELERIFSDPQPKIVALGTGRSLRAVVDNMQTVAGGHHKLASLIGNVAPDGSASFYEVIMRLADKTHTPHYPMSVPVMGRDAAERDRYRDLPHVQAARNLARQADLTIVGIGQMGDDAPMRLDSFITEDQHKSLRAAGAVGEIGGHVFDKQGRFLDHEVNDLLIGLRVPPAPNRVLCIGGGPGKQAPLRAALTGGLISGLITDEHTANVLLQG